MASDEVGRLIGEIGRMLLEGVERPQDVTFLYAEAAPAMVGAIIYNDRGNRLVSRRPASELMTALLDLWEAEEPARRWTAMTYVFNGGKFDASFLFPEDVDPEEDTLERQKRLLRQRFGDKLIRNPLMPE